MKRGQLAAIVALGVGSLTVVASVAERGAATGWAG